MGVKRIQGADGLEFNLQLTVAGLESVNLPEETLKNNSGNDIVKLTCWGGKVSAYVNLPHAVRPNNITPFQLSDCIKIEVVRNQVVEYMKAYLQKNLQSKYSDTFLKQMNVTKMECNVTVKCSGACKPKDVISLFEKSFAKVTVYKETTDKRNTHRKAERTMTTSKAHEWVLKVYDKTFQQRQTGNIKVEPNLIRVELVFLDRMLNRMYGDKRSLEDILTKKAIRTLIDQYQVTFDEICEENIKPMLNNCVQEVFETLTQSDSGNEIKDTLIKCKECIVDIEVLRKALKKWYAFRKQPDRSKQMIAYYRKSYFDFPDGVLKTIRLMHNSI